jgi:hypothetical protein
VVGTHPVSGAVLAPASLTARANGGVAAFDAPDAELRSLHAKVILLESDTWLAAMIGSSNATTQGYGLDPRQGHQELNIWIGCPARSKTAKTLRALVRVGRPLDGTEGIWEPQVDEEEPGVPALPRGFLACTLSALIPPVVELTFEPTALPTRWSILTPAGTPLGDADGWRAAGSPAAWQLRLVDQALPAYLDVTWAEGGENLQATWVANVENRSDLPAPADLADVPVDVLLAALASTRPLPVALEAELRRRARAQQAGDGSTAGNPDADPLRRFDGTGLLFHRTRQLSLALARLHERLSRPAHTLDALRARLHSVVGPVALASGLVRANAEEQALPGEAHFALAEIALTVADVDWAAAGAALDPAAVKHEVDKVLAGLAECRASLPPAPDTGLDRYLTEALAEVLR